jgi:elongation factor Ts
MMECKRALSEAAGDMTKAEEILRVKLGAKATKAATRVTAEGVVSIHIAADGKLGAILEVNCETDFVAKNDDFLALAQDSVALAANKSPVDVAALSALPLGDGTVETTRAALVGKIGENMSLRRFVRVEAKGKLHSYIHGGAKIGVLLDLIGGDEQLGKDIAMHIAALKPKALDASGVDAALVDSERRVATEKAAEDAKAVEAAGKKPQPPEIVAKRIEGAVQKFLKEVTLSGQVFVKAADGKESIEQLLKRKGASVAAFTLYVVGEGIEKKVSDFAAEVAAQSAAAQK